MKRRIPKSPYGFEFVDPKPVIPLVNGSQIQKTSGPSNPAAIMAAKVHKCQQIEALGWERRSYVQSQCWFELEPSEKVPKPLGICKLEPSGRSKNSMCSQLIQWKASYYSAFG